MLRKQKIQVIPWDEWRQKRKEEEIMRKFVSEVKKIGSSATAFSFPLFNHTVDHIQQLCDSITKFVISIGAGVLSTIGAVMLVVGINLIALGKRGQGFGVVKNVALAFLVGIIALLFFFPLMKDTTSFFMTN